MAAATGLVAMSLEVPGQAHDLVVTVGGQGNVVGLTIGLDSLCNQIFATVCVEEGDVKVGVILGLTWGSATTGACGAWGSVGCGCGSCNA